MNKSCLIKGTQVIKEYLDWNGFCLDYSSIPRGGGEYIAWETGDKEVYSMSATLDERDDVGIRITDLPPEQQALILMLG